jgi:hypothetical protein
VIVIMPRRTPSVTFDERTESNHSRSSSIRTTSSSGDSGRATAPIKHQRQPPKQTKSSTIRGFFSVKEPSALAFEQLAKKQRAEMAQKGQQYPSGVPRGRVPASAATDYKNQEANARKMAKQHENARNEGEKRPISASYSSPSPEPLPSRTSDLSQRRPSLDSSIRSMEKIRTESYYTPLAPVLENVDPRPSVSTASTASTRKTSLKYARMEVAPWEKEDEELSLQKKGLFSGFGKR